MKRTKRSAKKKSARTAKRNAPRASSHSPAHQKLLLTVERLNEWRRRLSVLLRFNKRANVVTDLDELLMLLIEESKAVLNAERATVFLVDRKQNQLWSKVASGTETIRIPIDKGIAGHVVSTAQILNIKDCYKDPR